MPNSEYSAFQSSPIEFYKFVSGSNLHHLVSADASHIGPLSVEYEPAQLERDGAVSSSEIARNTLTITTTNDSPIVAYFKRGQPDEIIHLTIFRKQVVDSVDTFIIAWKGRVIQCSRHELSADLICEPISSSVKRLGNRARFQKLCRHSLYDHKCLVSKAYYQINTFIESYAGNKVVVNSIDGKPANWMVNGYVITALGSSRMITSVSGRQLTLTHPFNVEEGGISCVIQAGCDQTISTCENRFNNKRRYGGFISIPTKNPYTDGPVNL